MQSMILIQVLSTTIAVLVALLTGVAAGFLTHLDGATVPGALMRSAVAFGACLSIGVAVLALVL